MDLQEIGEGNVMGTFVEQLGYEFDELTFDGITARREAAPHLHQPNGIVAGGAPCTVVETLGSVAATSGASASP